MKEFLKTSLIGLVVFAVLVIISMAFSRNDEEMPKKQESETVKENYDAYEAKDKAEDSGLPRDVNQDGEFSFNDYLVNQGLEKNVIDSHRMYVDESLHSTTGASVETVRDDDNDVNPRVGLRRTNYFDTYALPDARTVHSELPHQKYRPSNYCI